MFEKIKKLAQRRGFNLKKVSSDLGFSENYFYTIKQGAQIPADRLTKVADYFGVSTDYLLGRVEKENETVSREDELSIEDAFKSVRILTYNGVILTDEEKAKAENAIREVMFQMAMEERKKNQ